MKYESRDSFIFVIAECARVYNFLKRDIALEQCQNVSMATSIILLVDFLFKSFIMLEIVVKTRVVGVNLFESVLDVWKLHEGLYFLV